MILAWVISVCAGVYIGYKYNRVETALKAVQDKLEERRKREEEKVDSIVYDPDDVEQQVRLEHDRRQRELNPDE